MQLFRNVNDGFRSCVAMFRNSPTSWTANSRNGEVIRYPEPLTWRFSHPRERVLFNEARRANPFFHLYEAMWMLDGRGDLKSVRHYNEQMAQYSDDGETINDAYGYRWRTWFSSDQLESIGTILLNDPTSRRAVLTMWDADKDLMSAVYNPTCKAIPCNTHCYFEIENGRLNMTVCNRSNDAVWGAFGANAVHFSFLLEYMAAMIGVDMGYQTHFTTNLHIYKWMRPRFDKWINDDTLDYYQENLLITVPLVGPLESVRQFEDDLHEFTEDPTAPRTTRFLERTARPMMVVWNLHKQRDYDKALWLMQYVESEDWKIACIAWLQQTHKIWKEDDK